MDAKALIVFLLVGLVSGFIASFVVGGGGLFYYLIIGVIGAFVGGILLNAIGLKIATGNPLANQIITSVIGAVVVVIVARLIA